MIDVLIVLQSHSKTSANPHSNRYCGASKKEISTRCINSLFNTINYSASKTTDVNYRLIIVDDHSDEDFIDFLNNKKAFSKFPVEIIHLETYGIMPSILRCYQIGKEQGKDIVYFAQDDYLYFETALWEMLDAYFQFTQMSGMQVCIFPYDDPYKYGLSNYLYRLFLGAKRHWRNAFHTASCFLCTHSTIVDNWELFEKMGTSEYNDICEDISINRLFQQMEGFPKREINHLLFTPIPSLALHMGAIGDKDPYIDWKSLWDKFGESEKLTVDIPINENTVLNVGCGGLPFKDATAVNDIISFKEIRLDAVDHPTVDIVSSMEDLPMIPNNSIDCVYSSHSLEHIEFHKVPNCLKEWFRVLKPNGEIRAIVPNLKIPAKMILENKLHEKIYDSDAGPIIALDMIYGHRGLVQTDPWMSHKTGFTKEFAEVLLTQLGYGYFEVTEHDTNLLIRVFKR